jgi:HD-GYP domain-containing protein (c-di-GMP phosphodiesterase class II)
MFGIFKELPRLVTEETVRENNERELLELRDARYAELVRLPAVAEALTLLDNLPDGLVYHTKAHTEDVIRETILFALADGVSDGAIEQQVIAAAWHDIGYLDRKSNNESIAIEYLKKVQHTHNSNQSFEKKLSQTLPTLL